MTVLFLHTALPEVRKKKAFIITYDDGEEDGQVLRVPHYRYYEDKVFAKNVKHIKCLDCNVEFNFMEDVK